MSSELFDEKLSEMAFLLILFDETKTSNKDLKEYLKHLIKKNDEMRVKCGITRTVFYGLHKNMNKSVVSEEECF